MAKRKWWEYTTIMEQQIPVFDIPKNFAKKEAELCKKLDCDTMFYFVELDGEYIWPSKYGYGSW